MRKFSRDVIENVRASIYWTTLDMGFAFDEFTAHELEEMTELHMGMYDEYLTTTEQKMNVIEYYMAN